MKELQDKLPADQMAKLQESLNSIGTPDFKPPPYAELLAAVPGLDIKKLETALSDPKISVSLKGAAKEVAKALDTPTAVSARSLPAATPGEDMVEEETTESDVPLKASRSVSATAPAPDKSE